VYTHGHNNNNYNTQTKTKHNTNHIAPPLSLSLSLGISETEWDIFWSGRDWIRGVYDRVHLDPHQRVNHFRNFFELTR
jgi:hypothetical protein